MREHWTLQQYIDELQSVAHLEFEDVVHPDIIHRKVRVLKREMMERFSQQEMFMHGIIFEKID